jgi:hypothetical protein
VAIEEVSPMALAKELGVRPQQIYMLIRKGRINTWENAAGRKVVGREEVTNVLKTPQKRGRKTSKATALDIGEASAPVRVGDIASWRTPGGVRIAQVTAQDAPFNWMQDLWGQQISFRNHSLAKRIAEGVAKIERPAELLRMVVKQLQQDDETELADELQAWMSRNGSELARVEGKTGRVHAEQGYTRQDDDGGGNVRPDSSRGRADPQVTLAGTPS